MEEIIASVNFFGSDSTAVNTPKTNNIDTKSLDWDPDMGMPGVSYTYQVLSTYSAVG